MRLIPLVLLCCVHVAYAAAPIPSDVPPKMVLREEAVDAEPQVTITKETEQTVEEFRASGKLYMIKITPKIGQPYYLVDDRGDGKFSKQEALDSGFRPPRWVVHHF
jgi:Protein of unknown function (DUF2782)